MLTFNQFLRIEHINADITKGLVQPPISGTDGLRFIGSEGVLKFIAKLKESVGYFFVLNAICY